LLERVVENWLASVTEKAFELPLSQLLSLDGYTIIHIARPHGPMEQGKDILALTAEGNPCAFQVKARDLTLKDWRDPDQPLKGQIEDLLDVPIQHPAFDHKRRHESTLVTTGVLDDTLRQTLHAFNEGRRRSGKPTVNVLVKGQIESKIRAALGRFLPGKLTDTRDFLQLWLADGTSLPSRREISTLFEERISGLRAKSNLKEIQAVCGEIVILGSYLAHPFQLKENHISEIQVWTLVASTMFKVAALSRKAQRVAIESLGLVEYGITEAMQRLVTECETRRDYIEGNPWTDAYVYRARATLVAGYLGAVVLWQKWLGEPLTALPVFQRFWSDNQSQMWLWGEAAVLSFLAVGWAFDRTSAARESEKLVAQLVGAILDENGKSRRARPSRDGEEIPARRGLADPYVSVDEILREPIGQGNSRIGATYLGQSYTLESLVKILVHRRFRQLLQTVWYRITYVAFQTYRPTKPSDLWRWANGRKGGIEAKHTPTPTSWQTLLNEVETLDPQLSPPLASEYPHFLLAFLLVAPHRLNPTTCLTLEQSTWDGGQWIVGRKK